MKSEQKFNLFGKLKEEFENATYFSEYSHWRIEFEIKDDYSDDEILVCDVTISGHKEETVITLSIDINHNLKVNMYEDIWEEWESFNSTVRNLWMSIFCNKQCE